MTYSEQLADPRWQRKRLSVYDRDNFTCKSCGSIIKTLHAHHLIYFSHLKAWEYPDDLIETLCHQCHEKEKDRPEILKGLAVAFDISGFLYSDLVTLSTVLHDKKFSKSLIKKLRKIQNG